jgi:hypothetical protein
MVVAKGQSVTPDPWFARWQDSGGLDEFSESLAHN